RACHHRKAHRHTLEHLVLDPATDAERSHAHAGARGRRPPVRPRSRDYYPGQLTETAHAGRGIEADDVENGLRDLTLHEWKNVGAEMLDRVDVGAGVPRSREDHRSRSGRLLRLSGVVHGVDTVRDDGGTGPRCEGSQLLLLDV